jgi:hypothetical protein
LSHDRVDELAAAMGAIVRELAANVDTDAAVLAKLAVYRLYERYPDLTMPELDAVTSLWLDPA